VVLLLTLVPALRPSYAEAREGILLRGSGTGYVDVFVHHLVDIRTADIAVSGGGRYAGFFMVPDTATRHSIGALAVPKLGAGGDSGGRLVPLGPDFQVAPGTYRLYLISERGPTEVFIPIHDEPLIDVRPQRGTRAALREMSFVMTGDAGSDERRIRVHPQRTAMVAALQQVTSDGLTGTDFVATCLVQAAQECRRPATPKMRAPLMPARTSSYAVSKPGSYDAAFRVERGLGIHADTKVEAGVFTLDLVWLRGAPDN